MQYRKQFHQKGLGLGQCALCWCFCNSFCLHKFWTRRQNCYRLISWSIVSIVNVILWEIVDFEYLYNFKAHLNTTYFTLMGIQVTTVYLRALWLGQIKACCLAVEKLEYLKKTTCPAWPLQTISHTDASIKQHKKFVPNLTEPNLCPISGTISKSSLGSSLWFLFYYLPVFSQFSKPRITLATKTAPKLGHVDKTTIHVMSSIKIIKISYTLYLFQFLYLSRLFFNTISGESSFRIFKSTSDLSFKVKATLLTYVLYTLQFIIQVEQTFGRRSF